MVRRYEAMQILHQRAIGGVSSAENGDVPKTAAEAIADNVDYNAYHDCASAALLDPELAGDACRFSLLTAHWLIQMARVLDEEKRKECFGLIPEDCVKSLAEWIVFILRHGKAEYLLNGKHDDVLSVQTLVRCACELLSKRRWCAIQRSTRHSLRCFRRCSSAKGVTRAPRGPESWGVRGSATHELLGHQRAVFGPRLSPPFVLR